MNHKFNYYYPLQFPVESLENEYKEFTKTLSEEVFSKKVGQNPMFVVKPEEIPIISDILNDENQKVKVEASSSEIQPQQEIVNEVADMNDDSDDEETEIAPENYFF